MFRITVRCARALFVGAVLYVVHSPTSAAQATPPDKVDFMGAARSPISNSVAIPAGAAMVWVSGTVPSPADTTQPAGSRARYGDTKTQAISSLRNIEARLKERGLSMKDVVYIRCYLVVDKDKGSADVAGWNEAYGTFFNNATNPVKTARSTVVVAALVAPEYLVEVEAFAVYPKP
jgi:enamine deaminase RidA (YjgF/YER057c/UK114 family)